MDCCARGLKAAAKMLEEGTLSKPLAERYAGWEDKSARKMLDGTMTLEEARMSISAE